MTLIRLLLGTVYDLGRLMSGLSLIAGLVYLARSIVIDSSAESATAVTHFALSVVFWAIARIFRRHAI
jgi:hypothetical protein